MFKVGDKVTVYRLIFNDKVPSSSSGYHGGYYLNDSGIVVSNSNNAPETCVSVNFPEGRNNFWVLKEELRPLTKLEKALK